MTHILLILPIYAYNGQCGSEEIFHAKAKYRIYLKEKGSSDPYQQFSFKYLFNIILNSKVIVKSIRDPDNNSKGTLKHWLISCVLVCTVEAVVHGIQYPKEYLLSNYFVTIHRVRGMGQLVRARNINTTVPTFNSYA